MKAILINPISKSKIKKLDNTFKKDGLIVPVNNSFLRSQNQNDIQYYTHLNAIYGIVTNELVEYIANIIKGKRAIEIGSGNGTLGRALSIPLTDSHLQARKDIKAFYKKINTEVINYPSDVKKITALKAIKTYRPEIVVGSWITHKYNPKKDKLKGNTFGVDECRILLKEKVKQYIMLGNINSEHKIKPIIRNARISCEILKLPFCASRRLDNGDCLFIFTKKY